MRGRAAVAGVIFVTWLGIGPSSEALAQPGLGASRADDAPTQQARQLYKEGLKEVERGKWEKARDLFAQAFRLKPHVQIAVSLGQAEIKLGRHIEAAEHLAFFLREREGTTEADQRTVRQMLDEAQRRIGTLTITVDRPGAEIFVDGASVGRAPLNREVFVAPGEKKIEARLDGSGPASQVRTVKPGDYLRVELRLSKAEASRTAPTAAGAEPSKAAEGGPNKVIVVVGGVVAGLALAAGVGFHVAAHVKRTERDDAEQACRGMAACPGYDAADSARRGFATVTVASYIAAGVVGAGTLIYGLASPSARPPSAASAAFFVGPGAAGAMLTATW